MVKDSDNHCIKLNNYKYKIIKTIREETAQYFLFSDKKDMYFKEFVTFCNENNILLGENKIFHETHSENDYKSNINILINAIKKLNASEKLDDFKKLRTLVSNYNRYLLDTA